jgi:hypothetical protein
MYPSPTKHRPATYRYKPFNKGDLRIFLLVLFAYLILFLIVAVSALNASNPKTGGAELFNEESDGITPTGIQWQPMAGEYNFPALFISNGSGLNKQYLTETGTKSKYGISYDDTDQ